MSPEPVIVSAAPSTPTSAFFDRAVYSSGLQPNLPSSPKLNQTIRMESAQGHGGSRRHPDQAADDAEEWLDDGLAYGAQGARYEGQDEVGSSSIPSQSPVLSPPSASSSPHTNYAWPTTLTHGRDALKPQSSSPSSSSQAIPFSNGGMTLANASGGNFDAGRQSASLSRSSSSSMHIQNLSTSMRSNVGSASESQAGYSSASLAPTRSHDYAYSHLAPSASTATAMRPPLRSRVYGLGADLRPQTELLDPAFFPGGVIPAEAATMTGGLSVTGAPTKNLPGFSVELKAQSFDHRGYPVYSGRAASIKGAIRMKRGEKCDVTVKISAHTTSGSAAAVWDGVALQPPESGSERIVFQTVETLSADEGRVEAPNLTTREAPSEPVLCLPFSLNMPIGGSPRVVDGSLETVAVSLPPSFEMSSEQDAKEKAFLRNTASAAGSGGSTSGAASVKTSRTKMTAMTLRDAVEHGLSQVYRVGCFYCITFTLNRPKERDRRPSFFSRKNKSNDGSSSSASTASKSSDTLIVPFVFLGETTNIAPPPSSLPSMSPRILLQPSTPLAAGWESEVATAKWSGLLLRTMKRNVELELFLPAGKVIQAPSVIPILLIVRPEAPDLLPSLSADGAHNVPYPSSPLMESHTMSRGSVDRKGGSDSNDNAVENAAGQFPANSGHLDDSQDDTSERNTIRDQGGDKTPSGAEPPNDVRTSIDHQQAPSSSSQPAHASSGKGLSRLFRNSLSINRGSTVGRSGQEQPEATGRTLQPKSSRQDLSIEPRRSLCQGSDGSTDAGYTVRGGQAGGSGSGASSCGLQADLPSLIRVSLLQNVYYGSSSVNETPKNKRRLVSVADLEEVDLQRLIGQHKEGNASPAAVEGLMRTKEAQQKGVRVLKGLLRVGREATPSFRVQGIELKYAIKVDLLPFNPKTKTARGDSSRNMTPPRTPPGRSGPRPPMGVGQPVPVSTNTTATTATGATKSVSHPAARPSDHQPAGSTTVSVASLPQATHAAPRSLRHQPSSASLTGNSTETSPSASGGSSHAQPHSASSSAANSRAQSFRDFYGPNHSIYQGSGAGAMSEAGWTRRSPSDQTVLGPDAAKLHKTVGALWINVRLVKGRGAL